MRVILIFLLCVGCAFVKENIKQANYIDPDLKLTRDDVKKSLIPEAKSVVKEEVNIPKIIPIRTPDYTKKSNDVFDKKISISVTEDIPLKEVLIEIGRLADIDVEVDANIKGGIILRMRDKPLRKVLDRVCALGGLRYSESGGVFKVERDTPFIKNYRVDFLNLMRSNSSGVNIATQVLGGSASAGNLSSGSSNSLTSSYDGDIWKSIELALENIINFDPVDHASSYQDFKELKILENVKTKYTLNKQAGIITALANQRQHNNIEKFLTEVKESASMQVLIEAKIVEVSLDDQFKTGINWSAVDNKLKVGVAGNFTENLGTTAENISFRVLEGASSNFDAVLTMVEKFGVTRTLSNPRLHAMNNQQAILTFAENEVYFTLEATEEENENLAGNQDTTLTVESTINTVPIGVILALQPSIDRDNQTIIMNIRPTLSRITKFVTDPGVEIVARNNNLTDITSQVPVIEVRELDSVMKIKSGQVMVIGGLMEERVENIDNGVPVLSRIPFAGNIFKGVSKTKNVVETIIFIKATIVSNGRVQDHDRKIYNEFTNDPRPLF